MGSAKQTNKKRANKTTPQPVCHEFGQFHQTFLQHIQRIRVTHIHSVAHTLCIAALDSHRNSQIGGALKFGKGGGFGLGTQFALVYSLVIHALARAIAQTQPVRNGFVSQHHHGEVTTRIQ